MLPHSQRVIYTKTLNLSSHNFIIKCVCLLVVICFYASVKKAKTSVGKKPKFRKGKASPSSSMFLNSEVKFLSSFAFESLFERLLKLPKHMQEEVTSPTMFTTVIMQKMFAR